MELPLFVVHIIGSWWALGLISYLDLCSFLTWKAVWSWLQYLGSLHCCSQDGTGLSGCLLDGFQGQEGTVKEAYSADPCPILTPGTAILGDSKVEGLTGSPGLATRTQIFFPQPYQGFTEPASTASKWGYSYQLCPPPQVP